MRSCNTIDEFAHEVLRSAIWDIIYHERELKNATKILGFAKQLIERCNFTEIDITEIEKGPYDEFGEDEDDEADDAIDFARSMLRTKVWSAKHHEEYLKEGARNLALAQIVAVRLGYNFSIEEIQKQVTEQLDERDG